MRFQAPKPELVSLRGESLAQRLQLRRRQLNLTQAEAGAIIGTDEWSLRKWERGRLPTIRSYPGIIRFLGCEPWPEPTTLGERLLAERRRRGLPRSDAATLIGADESTFWRWETDQWQVHSHRCREAVEAFLAGAPNVAE